MTWIWTNMDINGSLKGLWREKTATFILVFLIVFTIPVKEKWQQFDVTDMKQSNLLAHLWYVVTITAEQLCLWPKWLKSRSPDSSQSDAFCYICPLKPTLMFEANICLQQRDGMRGGVQVQSVVLKAKLLLKIASLWILWESGLQLSEWWFCFDYHSVRLFRSSWQP